MTKLELGKFGEDVAVKYLLRQNYRLLGRNIRTRYGEIDILMKEGTTLIAIEVKTRRSQQYGLPCEAVNVVKQRHIRESMALYMMQYGFNDISVRFDVVEVYVLGDTVKYLRHLKGCF